MLAHCHVLELETEASRYVEGKVKLRMWVRLFFHAPSVNLLTNAFAISELLLMAGMPFLILLRYPR
jgi:hypothetical protein